MMDPEAKKVWIEALRSGKYEQGSGALSYRNTGSKEQYFCCLGVLCEVAGLRKTVERGEAARVFYQYYFPTGEIKRGTIPAGYLGINIEEKGNLVRLNDRKAASFDEIATWIEENL